jgi:heme/copper-type cytochrome/quinol oxidase subunit 2
VKKGDLVVLKITSSDVVHGFSLKDFGIFLGDGIRPGKMVLASFEADKVGGGEGRARNELGEVHVIMFFSLDSHVGSVSLAGMEC